MRTVKAEKFGGPEVLRIMEVADPLPAEGEICADVKACTVIPRRHDEKGGCARTASGPPAAPFALGMDVARIISEVGPGVGDLAVGDAVMAMVIPSHDRGAYSERIAVPTVHATRAPRNVDLAHAATLPMNGLTAPMALDAVALRPGEVVAVTGAAGAVGG